jgi:predicted PurR-regulated permease PerM
MLITISLAEKHWKNIGILGGDFKETQILLRYYRSWRYKMKPRIALFISVALTAFALVTVGAVLARTRDTSQVAATEEPIVEEISATPTIDPAIQQAFNEREAAYQELINQANQRLAASQQTQLALQAQIQAQQTASVPVVETTTISPDDAVSIAAQYTGDFNVYSVETTVLSGNTVYKVVFSSGMVAYVSLDGQVLGVAPAKIAAAPTSGGGGGGHAGERGDHDDGHEGGDD